MITMATLLQCSLHTQLSVVVFNVHISSLCTAQVLLYPHVRSRRTSRLPRAYFPPELHIKLAVMGTCCTKNAAPSDAYTPSVRHRRHGSATGTIACARSLLADSEDTDQLVLELLQLIASFVDNEEESPVSLVKLHVIADREEGWNQVVNSLVSVVPLENPLGPSAITIVFDDCPLTARKSVVKLTKELGLSAMRALGATLNVQEERNICVVLGCIAEKLAGPNSVAVLTEETLDYMLSFLMFRREPRIVLFAMIALEKFALTNENKLTIKGRLERNPEENPLLEFEKYGDSDDPAWRQVGFCARWTLDNIFVVKDRPLGYETVDMTEINAMLNYNDASEYLKISSDGLEARCDSYSFESIRCTFEINSGAWYYECTIVTPGIMQIGWATKNSHFQNHEGYGIGDDLYSLSYDGCRKLIWHEAKPTPVPEVEAWKPGDIVGCLLDMQLNEAIFYLNGNKVRVCTELFETTRLGFFAAASFMAFQQCRFNFGKDPFKFPPTDRTFNSFNAHGFLTPEEKKVVPRRILLEQLLNSSVNENACVICCDKDACCILEPCMHRGLCSVCTAQLKDCPFCRANILRVRMENT